MRVSDEIVYVYFAYAVFMWLSGYFVTTRYRQNTGYKWDKVDKIILPPKWLYYLCGAPVSKGDPKGAMRLFSFWGQMSGIFWGIFVVGAYVFEISRSEFIRGLSLSLLFAMMLTAYVSKYYAVRD